MVSQVASGGPPEQYAPLQGEILLCADTPPPFFQGTIARGGVGSVLSPLEPLPLGRALASILSRGLRGRGTVHSRPPVGSRCPKDRAGGVLSHRDLHRHRSSFLSRGSRSQGHMGEDRHNCRIRWSQWPAQTPGGPRRWALKSSSFDTHKRMTCSASHSCQEVRPDVSQPVLWRPPRLGKSLGPHARHHPWKAAAEPFLTPVLPHGGQNPGPHRMGWQDVAGVRWGEGPGEPGLRLEETQGPGPPIHFAL